MVDLYSGKYKEDKFPNPSDDQDPQEKVKNKEFFLKKSEWLYSQWLRDLCFIPYSSIQKFQECRLYAQGRQPSTKYMNQLQSVFKETTGNMTKGKDGPPVGERFVRKGMMNISWDIESPMPKFRAKVCGLLGKIEFNATAKCIDEQSDVQRNMMKYRRWAQKEYAEFLAEIKAVSGVSPSQDEQASAMPFEPQTLQEMEMIDKMGGFKLWTEVAMQKLVKWSFDLSDWDEAHKRLLEDFFDIGYAGTKDYTDIPTQRAKVRYVNPEYFVGRETRLNDFSELSEAGEIVFYSINTLIETGQFTDAEIRQIANGYQGQLGNIYLNWNQYGQQYPSVSDHSRYRSFKIPVLDFEFESTDTHVYHTRKVDGKEVVFEEEYSYNRKGKDVKRQKRKRFYKCKWIIGSKLVYDYGYQNDVPFHNDDEPRCSYNMYRVQDRSMTDLSIASLDSLQVSVLKYRNAKAKASPSGISVEFSTLAGMSLGGNTMAPMDILRIRRDSGDLIWKASVDDRGQPLQGIPEPIKELVGGMGPILGELITCFNYELNSIREITGLNAIVDASAPNKDSQVGTSKIAEQATNDVLRPTLLAYKNIKKRSARNMASRWQIIASVAKDPIRAVVTSIGKAYTEIIKVGSEISLPTYGIDFDATIDDTTIARIDAAAMNSMAMGKNGQPGITMSQYTCLLRMLEQGEVLLAELYLSFCEQKSKEELDARSAQNQQLASQGAVLLEQEKMKSVQVELAGKAQLLQTEYGLKIKENALKANTDAMLIRIKGDEERKTLTHNMVEAKRLGVEQTAGSEA